MPDIRVDIAPDADPDGSPSDWQYLDISSYRRQSADIELNQGRDDEAAAVEAADSTIVFDLRDGLLAPRNPNSELYQRIGVNTPIRYRLPLANDDFGRTVVGSWGTADSGQTWSTGPSFNAVNGGSGKVGITAPNITSKGVLLGVASLDIEVVYSVSIEAVTTGAPWISAVQLRRVDDDNHYRVHTELKPLGVITQKVSRVLDGVLTDLAEDLTVTGTYGIGTKVWTRAQAVGGSIRCKAWVGVLGDEPPEWNIVTSAVTIEGGGFAFYQWRFVGNTNVGTLTVSIDDFTLEAMLWNGQVPEWSPRWDKSGNDSTLTLIPAGPLRRLGQGEDLVESPLSRQLPRYSPAGYWKLEDGSEATAAASGIAGGPAAYVSAVSFGDADSPLGASSAMKLGATGTYNFKGQITGNTTGNFAALFFIKFASLPAGDTNVIEWRARSGNVRRWVIRAISTGWQVKVYDAVGDLLYDGGTLLYIDAPTEWTAVQLETVQDGANVDWTLIWNRVGSETFWASGDTFAGTSTRLADVWIPSSAGMVDALISHIWAGNESLPFVDETFLAVSSGYVGELASDRISRLCAERGVSVTITPGDSEPLGRQRPGRFLDLLREAATADVGVLYERLGALAYLPRSARVNVPVRMVLDWSGGDLAEAPQPTDDDQRLRNRWTVSRPDGSQVTAQNDESIRRYGTVSDSAEVNIASDDRLKYFAQWFTHLTSYDDLRWPSIQINLIANPHLIPDFLTCRIGSRVQVINPKDQVAGIVIDLIIEGIKQTIGRNRWDVTLTCSGATPWDAAVIESATVPVRLDTAGCELASAVSSTATSWTVDTTEGPAWNPATTFPILMKCGGEVVNVISITGAGPAGQVLNIDQRSVNGVVKGHDAGAAVSLAYPSRLAM